MAEEDLVARLRATGQRAFRSAMRGAATDVRSVGTGARGSRGELGKMTGKPGSGGRGGSGLLGAASAARFASRAFAGVGIAAGVGLGMAVREGSAYNKTVDSQRVGFETLLKSQSKARKFMRQIQALALKSPILDPAQTGDAARMLMAYGISAKDTLPFVEALGNMSAASGKDLAEVLPRGAMAIGQIGSKGKLQAEELNQLAESVGLSRKAIRKALGETQDEFEAHFRPGGDPLTDKKALPAILRAMEDQSAGAADKLAKTTQGKFSRLHEVFARSMGQLTRPLYDAAGDLAGGVARLMQKVDFAQLSKDALKVGGTVMGAFRQGVKGGPQAPLSGVAGFAQKAGQALRAFGKWASQAGKTLMETFKPAAPFFENVLLPLLQGFGGGLLGGVVAAVKIALPIMGLLAKGLGWVGTKAKPLRGVFRGIGAVIGFLVSGPLLGSIKVFGILGRVFPRTAKVARWFGGVVGSTFRSIGSRFSWIGSASGRAMGFIRSGWNRTVGFIKGLPGRIAQATVGMWDGIKDAFKAAINFIIKGWNDLSFGMKAKKIAGETVIPGFRIGTPNIPYLARGGRMRAGGPAVVGEKGPEVVNLRAGDVVTPNAALGAQPFLAAGARALFEVHVISELAGRQVGRGLARIAADDLARA